MKIFTDLHHNDLYYSLHSIFEKRLGFELYRPTGLEWFHAGFWKIAQPYGNAMDTVGQYLDHGHVTQKKWIPGINYVEDDIYYMYEPVHEYFQKAITFDKFKSMKFDMIVSSVQLHDHCYEVLQKTYQPQAKLIAHMGNTNQTSHIKNVIHSVPYNPSRGQNAILFHQEIDMNLYKYVPPNPTTKNLYSVVNCFPYPEVFNRFKKHFTDINMKAYGGGSPDGGLFGAKGVGAKMQEANFAWHLKPMGGIGHSTMGWFASGRGIVTNMSQHKYWGGNALKLFEPGITCINLEDRTFEENCKIIQKVLEPEEAAAWGERAHKRFYEVINYDAEELEFRKFLERLI